MKQQLEQLLKQFKADITSLQLPEKLVEIENTYFSRKHGLLTEIMKEMRGLSVDVRKDIGQFANEVKAEMELLLEQTKISLETAVLREQLIQEAIDVTQPNLQVRPRATGHVHPLTQGRLDMERIAERMGFIIEDGPELESDYYVFESLNIPKSHPARDSQDTFYIKNHPEWCMRSHVSNMQVRLMNKYGEGGTRPLRAAYPGRVFRNEALDATHEHTFYQFEACMVDREITIGNLVGVIQALLEGLFQRDVEVRLRPSYFPFVEPGFELDMKATIGGKEKWVEMLGCGLMHPTVLHEGGYDPTEWQGLAFGMGLNRLVMAKYGIEDIRHFHSGDLRFLNQF
jgi:phenylalanyl-tRNA synthetase alpha chain